MRRPCESNRSACGGRNSPGPVPVLPMVRRNFPFLSNTEIRATRFGSWTSVWLSATYTSPFRSVITFVGSVSAAGGLPAPPGRAQCHQHLSFRAELDDDTALGCFARELGKRGRSRVTRVGDPHISI